ncbi:uncharacterized protein MELLADRAFT_90870 [Melampsora larici-populina 98AG31]|uniref:Uncharacterized protein n=1 Tax=Melampsora larici-populina (strain 98AG31 / pathotype 3-4-7) TaxID=747676 RepID=F4R7T7_MELLP|nr:uncharacterized protein MELLADRAFT_90870 [Melampsora larici-populina 98AG31]EGG11372.1 hypothetical protein MELLADRAFT_90870 [Melampsora larici-populina 98AG31]
MDWCVPSQVWGTLSILFSFAINTHLRLKIIKYSIVQINVMDARYWYNHKQPGIATETYCSPEFVYRLHDIAKCIPQLKQTGENFSVWEKHLKVMIGVLTGSSVYLLDELHKHDPKFNRAVLTLIFWSIDEQLQQDLNIDGSAGDVFQFLAGRFRSNPSSQSILARADVPEEVLENIVNIVYHQSFDEKSQLTERKQERMSQILQKDHDHQVYSDHGGPPILDTFQTLAVVNRKFYRLCLPKLWQHLQFPSALPAHMSLWTEGILLRHGQLVKSFAFELEDLTLEDKELSELERSIHDNTDPYGNIRHVIRNGIGLVNIEKIFRACPSINSVEINITEVVDQADLFTAITVRLKGLLSLLPQLQHLALMDYAYASLPGAYVIDLLKKLPSLVSLGLNAFEFGAEASTEESLGWNLAQHQNLRKLRRENVTCKDQTWTLNSWPQRLTTLELSSCTGLTAGMVQKILSGSAPFLTRLTIYLDRCQDKSHVNDSTDLPALKHLVLDGGAGFGLLTSFKGCKDLELIQYRRKLYNNQWDTVKHFLSTNTWPNLLVLGLSHSATSTNRSNSIVLTKKDVDELWNSFKIKLLIN